MIYSLIIKSALDTMVAFCALLVLFPILCIVTIVLCIVNQGSPFFFQRRTKKKNVTFKIVKFRSMNNKKDASGNLLPDGQRLTLIGKFIRKTSIDELPQLINVLKGDMSIVGPRPLLPEYVPLYNIDQARRHEVKPGITGWAQVNGRNAISWQKKFELDVWYVDHISLLVDLKILFMTFKKVLWSENINASGVATTMPFKGNG